MKSIITEWYDVDYFLPGSVCGEVMVRIISNDGAKLYFSAIFNELGDYTWRFMLKYFGDMIQKPEEYKVTHWAFFPIIED